jgi:DNA invertase Pin-like site-specific DNA recombinase
MSVAAKLERRRIKERPALGRASARARDVKFGRKPKLTEHQRKEAIKRPEKGEETMREIAQSYNVSHQTKSRLQQ